MNDYSISVSAFSGPLNLLLELVRDKKVDLVEINLAELATKYLEMVSYLKDNMIDLASEYLVIAATLVRIKAKSLLNEEDSPEIIESKERLLSQLILYQKFKNIATDLKSKHKKRELIFIKKMTPYESFAFEYKIDPKRLDGHSSIGGMLTTLRYMFERVYAKNLRETKIEAFNLSPIERRLEILDIFSKIHEPNYQDIFKTPSISHYALTFVTILDMARKRELELQQNRQFDKITIINKGRLRNG